MVPVSRPRFSIIIPSFNGARLLERCLRSLEAMYYPIARQEWIVVDNGSSDDTIPMLQRRFPKAKILPLPYNRGFAGGIEAGIGAAEGEFLVFLNNDMRVAPEWLDAFEEALCRTGAACVTGKILDSTGSKIDFVQGLLLFDGHALQRYQGADVTLLPPHMGDLEPTFIACGGNMVIKKEIYKVLGGFDGDFFAYTEDVDFSWRLHAAGYEVRFVPRAVTFHEHQATSNRFGVYRRGFLYERNAFWCLYKNIDTPFFHSLMHAAWATLIHRTQWVVALCEPQSALWLAPPFPSVESAETLSAGAAPTQRENVRGLLKNWFRKGLHSLEDRGLRDTIRHGIVAWQSRQQHRKPRGCSEASLGELVWRHPYVQSQMQALWALSTGWDLLAQKRRRVQALRKVPDKVLFETFPPWVVTTYPGDEVLFGAPWFREWLPKEIPFRFGTLEDVHGNAAVQRDYSHSQPCFDFGEDLRGPS